MHHLQEPGAEDVHAFFGFSYANYLVLPRTLLQSMPGEWQRRLVDCLLEFAEAFAHVEQASAYEVRVCAGREPVPHYDRGRAYVEPKTPPHCGLCGHAMRFRRCGLAAADDVPLCHADDHSCYDDWTVRGLRPC